MGLYLGWTLLWLILVSFPASARDIGAEIDAYLGAHTKLGDFSGSVLIAKQGRTVLRKGYGFADWEHDIANTPETKFRLGSITKQFTATAIMLLQERGSLRVEDSIRTYMPDFPSYGDKITLHHLLTHSSGLHEYGANQRSFQKAMMVPRSLSDILGRMTAEPPAFEPGDKYSYSNSGFSLLGMIIEKLSGQRYEAYLTENFFRPHGMLHTGYDHSKKILKGRARGYARGPEGLENAVYIDMSNPYAAGAIYSTVDDLLRWDRALYTEEALKKKSLDAMFRPHTQVQANQSYGYGWAVGKQLGRLTIQHGGGINGFRTRLIRLVEDRSVIIVLSNIEHVPINQISKDLIAILYEKNYQAPSPD